MGFIASPPELIAAASWAEDQSSQRGSSVATSSSTLVSTSTRATSVLAAGERHDLVGAHADVLERATKAAYGLLGPVRRLPGRLEEHLAALHLELHFGIGQQAGL